MGAHPDDIEVGCGGALVKHKKNGDSLYGIILSKGENGKHCSMSKECKASAEILGLDDLVTLDFKDGEIEDNYMLVSTIEDYVKQYKPNIVYCHSSNDRHQDHRKASLATMAAARNIPVILLFQSVSSTQTFSARYYVDITETFDIKMKALIEYNSQLNRESALNMERIKTMAEYWGFMIKSQYQKGRVLAEAFEINHMIW